MKKKTTMQLGMVGLGRMGANMVRRLIGGGHECVVFDMSPKAVADLSREGAVGTSSLADFVKKLAAPRAIWLMVPAAVVDRSIADLVPLLDEEAGHRALPRADAAQESEHHSSSQSFASNHVSPA